MGWPTPMYGSRELGRISQLQRSSLKCQGYQPHTRLPSLEHQCQEEELVVKINGDFVHPENARNLLKGLAHKFSHS